MSHFITLGCNMTSIMSSSTIPQKLGSSSDKYFLVTLCKILAISTIIIYLIYIFLFNNKQNSPSFKCFSPLNLKWPNSPPNSTNSPTTITHIMFGLLGSAKAWKHRKSYIESWWRPNVTRGYIYLDTAPSSEFFPWPLSSPPLRISENISTLLLETKHVAPIMVRMNHAILEIFREDHEGVRWFVMGDDDSIFFVDNWVNVLGKYDHRKYVYVGGHSESLSSNFYYSFEQGFGGAGFALSFPLGEALVKSLEGCIRRYPYLKSADLITMTCIADLGVSLSAEKGIHQIDLTKDISGFLSSHPQAPLLSLHHFDVVHPIFPSMDRYESTKHLMKAANFDQSRLLQQTVCYNRQTNWSFSVSWGYATHIYEHIIPRSILRKPLETFRSWSGNNKPPKYLFNTRSVSNPCEAPHVFFLDKVGRKFIGNEIVTSYVRAAKGGLPFCSLNRKHSADYISKVQVFSPATKPTETGRSECCDVVSHEDGTDMAEVKVKIRACMKDEIIV